MTKSKYLEAIEKELKGCRVDFSRVEINRECGWCKHPGGPEMATLNGKKTLKITVELTDLEQQNEFYKTMLKENIYGTKTR